MSIAFLDSSIENQKGGCIKLNWIISLNTIFHEWHLVSFRVPIVALFHHILHISSTVISATGWAKVMRSVDDSQASWGSAEDMFCLQVLSLDGSNWMEAKWMDRGKSEMDEDKDANGHKRPCCIYWVKSLSKCKGYHLGAWYICPELGWYNTPPPNLK